MRIGNYSSKELKKLFVAHIFPEAIVTTDLLKGYQPLMSEYNITQIKSSNVANFKAIQR